MGAVSRALNGPPDAKMWLQALLALFSIILIVFCAGIRGDVMALTATIEKHEARLDLLEQFAAQGGRWSKDDHMRYEIGQARELKHVWSEIGRLREKVGP